MSGGMFPSCHPHMGPGLHLQETNGGQEVETHTKEQAQGEWNPLLCYLCHQTYRDPCLLACYHTFCASCLKGRSLDGKLSCPICGKVTSLRDGHSVPPTDSLLRFLVESSSDEFPSCANCDRNEKSPMFFCNTCGQALCGTCRDETHRAKMFSQHDVIHMSKKTKELHRKCQFHNEPFTMFCTSKKTLLCIKCFRDTSMEARLHCVDLDTAYNQGAKKLERALVSIKELQNSLRDGVILFRALLEELRRNMDQERRGLVTTYDLLHEAIKETYDSLLTSLDTRYAGTDRQLRAQLNSLGTMLPTVQMHLIMCTTFSSTANKFEFLTMAHHLIDRLTALAHLTYPLRPGHTSDLATDYKVRFVECLEPVLSSLGVAGPPEAAANTANGHGGHRGGGGEGGEQGGLANGGVASSGRAASKSLPTTPKHRSAARVEFQTDFPEHCQMFDGHMKVLNKRFGGIKGAVSDLHRDVTTRRCLTSYDRVEDIVRECVTIKTDLDRADDMMDEHKMEFEKRWQQEQLRIKTEQAMFNEQIMELAGLKNELRHLLVIAQQLEPYIRSISSLMERIQPQVGSSLEAEGGEQEEAEPVARTTEPGYPAPAPSKTAEEERLMAILERVQALKPEYKQRIEAIQKQESTASTLRKTSNSPLEDPALHHKQLLRTPSREDQLAAARAEAATGNGAGNGSAVWLAAASEQSAAAAKLRYLDRDQELPAPPLEYAELPRKGAGESNGDIKHRGILGSIMDRVRSKDEGGGGGGRRTVDCLPFSKEELRRSQPLLDNLLLECAGGKKGHDSGDSIVQKPYEPPALGKSSRITPVGGAEEAPATSQTQAAATEAPDPAVEVLSVIRYSKHKAASSVTPSSLRSHSSSDTASSVASQPCLACTPDTRPRAQSERSLATRGGDSAQLPHLRSRSSSRPDPDPAAEAGAGAGAGPYLRRSSAPEIDQECGGGSGEEEAGRGAEMYTRSLGRTQRRPHGHAGDSGRSSDAESHKTDPAELQRARAHLKETLEGKMRRLDDRRPEDRRPEERGETRAVVHRAEAAQQQHARTLDSEAIKQYRSIQQNTAQPGAGGGQQRYSGMFGDTPKLGAKERGREPREVREPREPREHTAPGIYKQTSFDNLARGAQEGGGQLQRDRHEGATTASLRDSHSPLFAPELKKQDSFEGHEAAVRSLVEAVHESRKLEAKQRKKSDG